MHISLRERNHFRGGLQVPVKFKRLVSGCKFSSLDLPIGVCAWRAMSASSFPYSKVVSDCIYSAK
jgi:hypothetical protein